jgi:hypothetical protein
VAQPREVGEQHARVVRTLWWPLLVGCLRQPRAQVVLMNDGDRRRLARLRVLPARRTQLNRWHRGGHRPHRPAGRLRFEPRLVVGWRQPLLGACVSRVGRDPVMADSRRVEFRSS